MSQAHRAFEDLLPAYVLGALEGDEQALLAQHLAVGCADCERELSLLRRDIEALAGSAKPVTPKPSTKEFLLAELRGEIQKR